MTQYSARFFNRIHGGSMTSGRAILAILGAHVRPRSLIDIGCGAGSWMEAAREVLAIDAGAMLGVDGPHAKPMHTGMPQRFQYQDLAQPLRVDGRFDLAMSVEVAEHLPAARADSLVEELCGLSDVVLFAAAVPGQGGTGHVNEQWPDYWAGKFQARGYRVFDPFRPLVWHDPAVAPWYAQNCFLFVRGGHPLCDAMRDSEIESTADWRLGMVHPGILRLAACETAGAGRVARALPRSVWNSMGRRLSSIFGART